MSYRAYPMKKQDGHWVHLITREESHDLACVASVPGVIDYYQQYNPEAMLYDMSDIHEDYVDLCNFLTSVLCTAHKDWYTHDNGLRSPVFVYDHHTYDDMFYAISPFRQIMEYRNVVSKFMKVYPLERWKTLTPRQVKRLWFAVNRINVHGFDDAPVFNRTGNNHSAFTLLQYCNATSWTATPRAASQLINSDTYWRSRVGYPEGKKPKPFNKAGSIWTVATRDVSVCPMFACSAKHTPVKSTYTQDHGSPELTVTPTLTPGKRNTIPKAVKHCFVVYDAIIDAVKPVYQSRQVKFTNLELFINSCKRKAA